MPTDDSYREKLDARAENLNRWLMGAAVLCTLLAALATIVIAKGVVLDMSTVRSIEERTKRLDDHEERLTDLIEAAERQAEDWKRELEATAIDGYERSRRAMDYEDVVVRSGALHSSESEAVSVELEAGWDYTFIGICDDDCIDLDLVLRLDNVEVEMDALLDALPIIDYSPTASDEFQIDVHMVECEIEPCSWQLEGFRTRAAD